MMADRSQEKIKTILKVARKPTADFKKHKEELAVVIQLSESWQSRPWWDVSFSRVFAASAITIGIVAGLFVVGPLGPQTKNEVLAGAENVYYKNGEDARYYYAKEKIVSELPKNEGTFFLEMHEDIESGDVYTKMFDADGRMVDEHAIVSDQLYVCAECIREKLFANELTSELIFADSSSREKADTPISERIYYNVWDLQSNPDAISRTLLFEKLKARTDAEYIGEGEWKDFSVKQIQTIDEKDEMSFKTVFYFEADTLRFKGAEDFVAKMSPYKKVGSREILEESYSSEQFIFNPERLQQVVFE
jgi:hypothetical protein